MSFDRIDYNSGAYPGNLSRQSQAMPGFGRAASENSFLNFAGRAAGPTASAHHTLAHQWVDKAAIWGSQDLASGFLNSATKDETKAGQKLSTMQEAARKKLGANPPKPAVSATDALKSAPKSYSDIFHLGKENVPIEKATWSNYSETVKRNLSSFKDHAKPSQARTFFQGTSAKSYVKDTLGKNNFQPVKDVLTNAPNKEWGTAAFRTAAGGLMGYDVLKHTHDAYKTAKAKEDGSMRSRLHTMKETTVAFGKYAFRDGATWEAAGVGAAIGKAVIPIALGGVSMGGIAVGALAGIAAQKLLDKGLKTGDKDPVQQQLKREKELKAAEKANHKRVQAIEGQKDQRP